MTLMTFFATDSQKPKIPNSVFNGTAYQKKSLGVSEYTCIDITNFALEIITIFTVLTNNYYRITMVFYIL